MATKRLYWKCHTTRLLEEVLSNPGTSALQIPMTIFRSLLAQVAQRSAELNDDKLNLLMMRLTLYECADPLSENYNSAIMEQLEQKLEKAKS